MLSKRAALLVHLMISNILRHDLFLDRGCRCVPQSKNSFIRSSFRGSSRIPKTFFFFFFLFLDFAFCWVFLCLNTRHLALGCSLGQEAKLFVFPRELPATWGYDSVTSPPRHPDPERGPDLAGSIFFLKLELPKNCTIAQPLKSQERQTWLLSKSILLATMGIFGHLRTCISSRKFFHF